MGFTWDRSNMVVTQSDLAKATVDNNGIRLDFGASVPREGGGASDIRLQRRILLDKESATNLLKLLNSLISRQNSGTAGGA